MRHHLTVPFIVCIVSVLMLSGTVNAVDVGTYDIGTKTSMGHIYEDYTIVAINTSVTAISVFDQSIFTDARSGTTFGGVWYFNTVSFEVLKYDVSAQDQHQLIVRLYSMNLDVFGHFQLHNELASSTYDYSEVSENVSDCILSIDVGTIMASGESTDYMGLLFEVSMFHNADDDAGHATSGGTSIYYLKAQDLAESGIVGIHTYGETVIRSTQANINLDASIYYSMQGRSTREPIYPQQNILQYQLVGYPIWMYVGAIIIGIVVGLGVYALTNDGKKGRRK